MTRHCTRCDSEVEDTGGYCLLGHPLRHSMDTASLDDLKRDVDAAFESAQDEVREVLNPLIEQAESVSPTVPEPVYAAAIATAPARYAPSAEPTAPVAPAAPATDQPKRPTPPPPPPRQTRTTVEELWAGMDDQAPLDRSDPINAFAPPPRMDWGPERASRKTRSLRRIGFSNA